jgi:putative flippase GtrA
MNFRLFIKYIVSGGLGAAIQVFVLYVWVSLLGLEAEYIWGVVIGFCIATSVGFLLQKYWTFRAVVQASVMQRQFVMYACISLAGLVLNTLLITAGKFLIEVAGFNFFHIWYLAVQICITGIVAIINFTANYFITFRAKKNSITA